ncbi:MAG: EF-hand domain-containing protein [Candidatus Hydrogenedentes bacterium]|nr:EF-hand domain-containing protein [Candidatus Hydrogenedentota bacterium]
MRPYRICALTLSVAASVAYCAMAEPGPNAGAPGQGKEGPNIGRAIQKADKNGDGKVTYEELKAVIPQLTTERYKEMDHTGDGVLTKEDRPQAEGDGPGQGGNRLEELATRADANHDGKSSFDELRAVAPKMTQERFNMLDKNHDGFLSADDKPRGGGAGNRAEVFKQADANHDGKVTLDELKVVRPNLTKERFDTMDTNHDGVLSPEDRPHQGKPGAKGARAGAVKAPQ